VSEEYRVPKRRVTAEVTLVGRPPVTLLLFLGDGAVAHRGRERPSDLLAGPDAFLAAVEPRDEAVILVRRDAVAVMTVPVEEEYGEQPSRPEDLAAAGAVSADVEVVLEDGTSRRGTITYLLPEGRRRLQDHLNGEEPFLVLREGASAHLINKRRLASVSAARAG
jgi:hypothetical protein